MLVLFKLHCCCISYYFIRCSCCIVVVVVVVVVVVIVVVSFYLFLIKSNFDFENSQFDSVIENQVQKYVSFFFIASGNKKNTSHACIEKTSLFLRRILTHSLI